MATIDPEVKAALDKYGLGSDAIWQHKQSGKYIMKHWACEHVAIKAGIKWDAPTVVQACAKDKIAVVVVTGRMGERAEWSFGEAAPYNTQQAYPFAMAEKRAKDRVVLKLIGVHGKVYSEEEADDFKNGAREPDREPAAQDWNLWAEQISADIAKSRNAHELSAIIADRKAEIDAAPDDMKSALRDQYKARLSYHQRSAAA